MIRRLSFNWILMAVCLSAPFNMALETTRAVAEEAEQEPTIFRRFESEQVAVDRWQIMPEVPVWVRPVAEPDARVTQNRGANFVVAFRPRNRIYFSRGYDLAQATWHPKAGSIRKVEVTSLDISEMINFSIKRVAVLTIGLGLGLMDGLIKHRDGTYQTRLEPFVPIQLGFGFNLGSSFSVGFKLSQHIFLGPGDVVSLSRGLIGIGYYY